jgi:hypothetical protein
MLGWPSIPRLLGRTVGPTKSSFPVRDTPSASKCFQKKSLNESYNFHIKFIFNLSSYKKFDFLKIDSQLETARWYSFANNLFRYIVFEN